jgi:hypothetical protein
LIEMRLTAIRYAARYANLFEFSRADGGPLPPGGGRSEFNGKDVAESRRGASPLNSPAHSKFSQQGTKSAKKPEAPPRIRGNENDRPR